MSLVCLCFFFFSSRRRHTRCALVTGVQTCALPIYNPDAEADLAPLDDGLTNADPAIKGALEDKIMVDPALTGQSNRNALGPGNRPIDGGVPGVRSGKAATAAEAAAALKEIGRATRREGVCQYV